MSRTVPGPDFKYGLGVSFDASTVKLPSFAPSRGFGLSLPLISGDQGVCLSWEAALRSAKTSDRILRHYRGSKLPDGKIWSWHESVCTGGLVIHLPRGRRLERPIRLEYRLSEKVRLDRLLIIAEPGSRATVIEHLSSEGDGPCWRGLDVSVIADRDSRIDYVAVQNLADDHTAFARKRADGAEASSVSWVDCAFGGDYISDDTAAVLRGEGSSTSMHNLFFGAGRQRFDLIQRADHLARATRSNLVSRGALDDRARAVCRGLIRMARGSRGCQGRQKTDTLLLHEKARISALPTLEIAEDDVTCGHASAIGRLDQEKLFYLMSRGLDEPAATRQLINGFFAPLVREMRDHGLEDMVSCLIGHRLGSPPDKEFSDDLCQEP